MSIELRWLGHNCWSLRDGKHWLLIDPFLSGSPTAPVKPQDVSPDFILISHGLRQIMPHPLPAHLAPDDSVASKEQIALHTFSSYGAMGWFATFEDTIPLREVPRSELKEWMDRHPNRPANH